MSEKTEYGWLIEHGASPSSAPLYWTGRSMGTWSGNHMEACRFARREDAFRVSLWLGDATNRVEHRIAEHAWDSRP